MDMLVPDVIIIMVIMIMFVLTVHFFVYLDMV